ncbi:hypothetical protein BB561_002892 [Smittium simulii]|uniref:Uncharacterized protein n=1 Tax=Smittium simulii TaxID=133385 RepID=A0A2T9YNR5_9FUNG|nr:hypothetical protein BB561_002892 [Smittium simulii]
MFSLVLFFIGIGVVNSKISGIKYIPRFDNNPKANETTIQNDLGLITDSANSVLISYRTDYNATYMLDHFYKKNVDVYVEISEHSFNDPNLKYLDNLENLMSHKTFESVKGVMLTYYEEENYSNRILIDDIKSVKNRLKDVNSNIKVGINYWFNVGREYSQYPSLKTVKNAFVGKEIGKSIDYLVLDALFDFSTIDPSFFINSIYSKDLDELLKLGIKVDIATGILSEMVYHNQSINGILDELNCKKTENLDYFIDLNRSSLFEDQELKTYKEIQKYVFDKTKCKNIVDN